MTIDERLDRIEHVTAGLAEERRKDREENRRIWRDTQRQLNELALRVEETDARLGRRIEEVDERLSDFITASKAADDDLRKRIEGLVSGLGEFMREMREKK
jgi:hypothetical protein